VEGVEAKLDLLLEQKKPTPKNRIPTKNAGCDVAFNLFWSAYPVKKGKKAARNVYMRIPSSKYPMIHADIKKRMENDAQWMEGYIPHPATYLNGERWEDEITPVVTQAETMPKENSDLVAWAGNKGFRSPRPGESFTQYRMAVQQLYRT